MFPLGHLGMALLFAAPVAAVLRPRTQTGFTVYVLSAALLPDVDTYVPGLTHHGLTHTVGFAVAVSVVVGGVLAGGLVAVRKTTAPGLAERFGPHHVFAFVSLGLFLGVVSHVVADALVLFPNVQPVSPLWPISHQTYHFGFIGLGAPIRNASLLVLGVVAHAVVSWRTSRTKREDVSTA